MSAPPPADLTDVRVLLRAMPADVGRLAEHAGAIAAAGQCRRAAAGRFLTQVVAEIRRHHVVEETVLWPIVARAAVPGELADLHRATESVLAVVDDLAVPVFAHDGSPPARATERLTVVLRTAAGLLSTHERRTVERLLPLLAGELTGPAYAAVQRAVRRTCDPATLAFHATWLARHATAAELQVLLAQPGTPMRVLLAIFGDRFAAHERFVFTGDAA